MSFVASFHRSPVNLRTFRPCLRPHLSASVFQNRFKELQVQAKRQSGTSGINPEDNEDSAKEPIIEGTPSDQPEPKETEPSMSAEKSEEKETKPSEPEPVSAAIEIEEEEVPQQWGKDRASDIRALKAALIAEVAGLDRGFAAVPKDTARIRSIIQSIETISGSVDLTGIGSEKQLSGQEMFNGTWKLVYSSRIATGERLPLLRTPFRNGPVYQVVNTQTMELDNVVELLARNVPPFPWIPANAVPKLRVTLRHEMSYNMSIVTVRFKEAILNVLDGGFEIPKITIPSILSLFGDSERNRGEFSLLYLDSEIRITEGDKSETRVFVKVPDLE